MSFLMMGAVRRIVWDNLEPAFPDFPTLVGIPLTCSISHGIGFGFISHVLIKFLRGKAREVHPLLYVIGAALALHFLVPALKKE